MNKQSIFCLIMAIFWTLIAGLAIYFVLSLGIFNIWTVLILVFAALCAGLQWLRFKRTLGRKENKN